MITIHQTKDSILTWILSCNKPEQVDLLADVVAEFIVKRFEKLENQLKIEIIRDFLIAEMKEQKLIIERINLQSFHCNVDPDSLDYTHEKFDYE